MSQDAQRTGHPDESGRAQRAWRAAGQRPASQKEMPPRTQKEMPPRTYVVPWLAMLVLLVVTAAAALASAASAPARPSRQADAAATGPAGAGRSGAGPPEGRVAGPTGPRSTTGGSSARTATGAEPGSPGGLGSGASGNVDATVEAAWRGHGDLAYVSAGSLKILDSAGAVTTVTGPPAQGTDGSPAWSADGRWLAFLHRGPAEGFSVPLPTLWVARRGEGSAQQVGTEPASSFAWSPTADVLAFAVPSSMAGGPASAGGLWTDVPGRAPARLVSLVVGASTVAADVAGPAWSAGGGTIAFGVTVPSRTAVAASSAGSASAGGTPAGASAVVGAGVRAVGELDTVGATGGPIVTLYRSPGSGVELAGPWPGGGGWLFWSDAGFSASIAADGLPLRSLATGSDIPTTLATTLVGSMWLAPDPAANAVAVVAGAGRSVWQAGRHVEVCRFPAAPRCQPVPTPAGTVGLYPLWGPNGDLLFSTADAGGPLGTGPGFPAYGTSAMARWDRSFQAWTAPTPGGRAGTVTLAASEPGSILARAGSPGTALLVVRDDALWIQPLSTSTSTSTSTSAPTSPVEVAGPLFSPAVPTGYYGEVDWDATFAWSEAPGPRGGTAQALSAATDVTAKP